MRESNNFIYALVNYAKKLIKIKKICAIGIGVFIFIYRLKLIRIVLNSYGIAKKNGIAEK
jgi:hypothetical protein